MLANPSHSAASYCLIYHSTKNEPRWREGGERWGPRQKIGADRDEARRYETKSEEEEKKDERARERR